MAILLLIDCWNHKLCLSLAAENPLLDCDKKIDEPQLKCLFSNESFAMALFEQIDETEQHLLAITDVARMMVQTRAFASGLWLIANKYECARAEK